MSEITQKDIWALELSDYFIKKHQYQLMTLNKETKEMWLINPNHELYPILMISTLPTQQFNQEELMLHRHALAMLLKSKPEGINFSVNQDSEFTDATNVLLGVDTISNKHILNEFVGLDTLLRVSSNLTFAMNKVGTSIQKNMLKLHKIKTLKATMGTTILSVFIIVMFALSHFIMFQYKLNYTQVLLLLGAYYKPLIVNANQWWRLITPMFLHGDFLHILVNLLAMRNMALILEKELGTFKFISSIFLGVLFGNVFLFIRNDLFVTIGISGGIYALFGILMVYLFEKDLHKNRAIQLNLISTIFINIFISMMPNVSMTAHLGGLYVGVLLGFIYSKRKDWDVIRLTGKLLLVASVIVLGIMMVQNAQPILVESLLSL